MTTIVTVETHDWPVEVQANTNYSHTTDTVESYGHSGTRTFVPANTKQAFTLTDGTTATFRELPKGVTSFADADARNASAQLGSAVARRGIAD
jgi:hypothetical protein